MCGPWKKPPSIVAYLQENVHYTFSGMNFPPTFLKLVLELGGVDRIMFSQPTISISPRPRPAPSWSKIPVSAADKARIAHGNAERLFRL